MFPGSPESPLRAVPVPPPAHGRRRWHSTKAGKQAESFPLRRSAFARTGGSGGTNQGNPTPNYQPNQGLKVSTAPRAKVIGPSRLSKAPRTNAIRPTASFFSAKIVPSKTLSLPSIAFRPTSTSTRSAPVP
ncbi:hypothetical protein HRbin30_03318 [bacterium HR30]|nr:hypothetical protein HRbin30_03318 [bacterium HR30]